MPGKMKKKTLLYIMLAGFSCLVIFTLIHLTKPFINFGSKPDKIEERASEPILGVYDRNEKMTSNQATTLRHFIIKWNNSNEDTVAEKQLSKILEQKQAILLTIEMWSKRGEPFSTHGILQGMINGDYDKKVRKLCDIISASQNTAYLRWNPEMEVPINKYPWQSQSNSLYIDAFRHFSELCKKSTPNAKIV